MFGKFGTIEEFLSSYIMEEELKRLDHIHSLSIEKQIELLQSQQTPDVAEVRATIKERQPDDLSTPKHYQMLIVLDSIIQFAPNIKTDIFNCQQHHSPVFVAIRYGDRMGISQPITTGMNTGDKLHLKGQWITSDKAYSHGGAKMSVLHFTHHPAGFTCTTQKCYS